jgi:hypothetical protein
MTPERESEIRQLADSPESSIRIFNGLIRTDDICVALMDLLEEIDRMRKYQTVSLRKYGKHLSTCDIFVIGPEAACNCGFYVALRDLQ